MYYVEILDEWGDIVRYIKCRGFDAAMSLIYFYTTNGVNVQLRDACGRYID